jgi:hypothetical protein
VLRLSQSQSQSYVKTDGQSARLSWNKAPIWGPTTKFLLLSDSCGFVDVGRFLRREDGSVVYNYCWPSPEQQFSGPSLVGLVTIFYCLRFEISLSVASYDSRDYGGGIRPRLHTRVLRLFWGSRYLTAARTTQKTVFSVALCLCWGIIVMATYAVHWPTGCYLARTT